MYLVSNVKTFRPVETDRMILIMDPKTPPKTWVYRDEAPEAIPLPSSRGPRTNP